MNPFSVFGRRKPVVIVAPDKFKGTLTAADVSREIAAALGKNVVARICPMCDGGDGTAATLAALRGLSRRACPACDALGRPCDVPYYAADDIAVVDSASAVGLAALNDTPLRPFFTTSYGLGMVVKELAARYERVYVGIGGTATIDGGAGFLQAMGVKFMNVRGEEMSVPLRACDMAEICSADFSALNLPEIRGKIVGLSDVAVPLLRAADFAPQKGVTSNELPALLRSLENFADVMDEALLHSARPDMRGGAGGGLGYALERVLRCPVVSGAEFMMNEYEMFREPMPALVVTGEGKLDTQTSTGKVVHVVSGDAAARGIPVLAVVGKCELPQGALPQGMEVLSAESYLGDGPLDSANALNALRMALRAELSVICSRMLG